MIIRILIILLVLTGCGTRPHVATTRDELVSELNKALDARDKTAFEKCFNHEGAIDDLRSVTDFEEKIFAMPTHYVSAKERVDQGKMHFVREGKNYTLNGDWLFNIGIYISKHPGPNPDRHLDGYVVPAGMANGKCQILMTVEDKP